MDKEDVVHISTIEYYSAIKKNEIFAATWMDLEIIILSEVSQRRPNTIWFHLYVESKKKNTNFLCVIINEKSAKQQKASFKKKGENKEMNI